MSSCRPSAAKLSDSIAQDIIQLTQNMLRVALKLAAPVFATLLVVNTVLAVLGRAVPQMNVFVMSFPLTIGAGLPGDEPGHAVHLVVVCERIRNSGGHHPGSFESTWTWLTADDNRTEKGDSETQSRCEGERARWPSVAMPRWR
jgi:hypothetical protein